MPWYRMQDGNMAHFRVSGKRAPKPCVGPFDGKYICGRVSGFQCDWKLPQPGGRCDRWLCTTHAKEVAKNKHLCPEHQVAYQEWLTQRQGVLL